MYINRFANTIKKNEKVIDLGSGNDPHPRADVYVDCYTEDNYQRDGASFIEPKRGKLVNWDLNKYPYPFKDKEFDFVITAHIAEHLEDPIKFCKEIQRIGKRGYLETPVKLYEQIFGWPFHLWFVYKLGDKLIFEEINKSPFSKFGRLLYQKSQAFRKLHDNNIEYLLTSFYWEDNFKYEVVNDNKIKIFKYITNDEVNWEPFKRKADIVFEKNTDSNIIQQIKKIIKKIF